MASEAERLRYAVLAILHARQQTDMDYASAYEFMFKSVGKSYWDNLEAALAEAAAPSPASMPSEAERARFEEALLWRGKLASDMNGRQFYDWAEKRLAELAAAAPSPASLDEAPAKPCYILGRETIERVADEGQLDTERVAFVAADELFHKNPYRSDASLDEAVRVGVAQIIAVGVSTDVPVMQISRNILDALVRKGLLK